MNRKSLNHFRLLLNKQLDELTRKSDGALSELLIAIPRAADPLDYVSMEVERELTIHMLERDKKLLLKIREALRKIDCGTYGICEECGEDIDINRLEMRPVAELCITCKRRQEKMEKLTCEQD
jgi:DnaK suppressor protein